MVYNYPIYNVSICNFNELFEFVKQQLHAQCIKYNLAKCDNDYKKMLMHCIVKACCDVVAQHKDTKLVFFVQPSTLQCNDTLTTSKYVHGSVVFSRQFRGICHSNGMSPVMTWIIFKASSIKTKASLFYIKSATNKLKQATHSAELNSLPRGTT